MHCSFIERLWGELEMWLGVISSWLICIISWVQYPNTTKKMGTGLGIVAIGGGLLSSCEALCLTNPSTTGRGDREVRKEPGNMDIWNLLDSHHWGRNRLLKVDMCCSSVIRNAFVKHGGALSVGTITQRKYYLIWEIILGSEIVLRIWMSGLGKL